MPSMSLRSAATVLVLVRRFLPHLRPVRWRVAIAAMLTLLDPLIAVALLALMKSIVDEVFVAGRIDPLPGFAAAYVGLIAGTLMISYVTTRVEASLTEQIILDVRVDLYRHLMSISQGSLKKYSVGDLLAHVFGDPEHVEYLIYSGPLRVLYNLISAAFFTCFLLILSWKLTLCVLLVAPVLALVSTRLASRVRRSAKIARQKETALMSLAEERLASTPVVHAFDATAVETAAFRGSCQASRRADLRNVSIQAWMTLVIEAVAAFGGLIVLGVGAYEMHTGSLSIGALISFIGSGGFLYSPIRSLARAPVRFQRAAVSAQRVVNLLDTPSLVVERSSAKPLERVQGLLEFRNVSFAYPDGPEVLHDVSFRVEPGETVAIVGPNGSGKSTLIRLALRFYDPTRGAILLDGKDLRDITLESLRRAVTIVFQESYIFRGSIGANIRYGRTNVSDAQFLAMAQAANVHAFASALPSGYGTPAGPSGGWLSGGQRQCLALARAFVRDATVLLLDEATASVDGEAEELIQDAVEHFAGKRTILLVGHRLSSVRRADRVVVMEGGRIVEIGTSKELLGLESRYRNLFTTQLTAVDGLR